MVMKQTIELNVTYTKVENIDEKKKRNYNRIIVHFD